MSQDQPPQGQRFSHLYLDRREPTQDSARMRRRIAASIRSGTFDNLGPLAEQELGVDIPWHGSHRDWVSFLAKCDLRDALDLVTITFRYLFALQHIGGVHKDAPARWLSEIGRILAEENVHYRVDDQGGIHFHFDEEFARNRASTIGVLQAARYANSLHAFEEGMAMLAGVPPNGKGAIRAVFAATEAVFKLILPAAPRLGAAELGGLEPVLQRLYPSGNTARRSSLKMLSSFKDWVDAAHFYRHEQGAPDEVAQPPLNLAVYLVSSGASHLRWLAELDAPLQA